jgi:hypothetical protein
LSSPGHWCFVAGEGFQSVQGRTVLPERPSPEARSLKPFRLSALWLIVGAVAVLTLLPILNVLFHIEEVMPPVLPPLILLVCFLLMIGGGFRGLGGVSWMRREREGILKAGLPARAVMRSAQLGGVKVTYGGADERWRVVLGL